MRLNALASRLRLWRNSGKHKTFNVPRVEQKLKVNTVSDPVSATFTLANFFDTDTAQRRQFSELLLLFLRSAWPFFRHPTQ